MWRILVTDDEPDVRAIICATLRAKYEVFEAHDGLDALEKIERVEPDFVIMDVMMPIMDGFAACDAIRKNPRFSTLPVMFLTALGTKEDMKKGYGVGGNLYLTKPFDPSRLLRNIEVFFETAPPTRTQKRYSSEQLLSADKQGLRPVAPGSAEYETPHNDDKPIGSTTDPGLRETRPIDRSKVEAKVSAHASFLPRILLVDDDAGILEVMRLTLGDSFEVVVAHDGIEAVEKLVRYQPDLLVLDVMLPKMSGYQLLERLRANVAFATLPILVCSAKGAQRDIEFARRMGANDYLPKPFSSDQLSHKIKDLQRLPIFRVKPKTLSMDQITSMETPKEVFAGEQGGSSDRNETPGKGRQVMADFLRKAAQQDPFAKGEEKKRTRKLFGFGGSKTEE